MRTVLSPSAWLLLLSHFLWLHAAQAQASYDHLVPPPGALALGHDQARYQQSVRHWLLPGATAHALLQVVGLPSFAPEYSLIIERSGPTAYTLTYRLAKRSIWQTSGYSTPPNITLLAPQTKVVKLPAHPSVNDSIAVATRQMALSPQLAQALVDVLSVALAQARYPVDEPLYVDGTRLCFSLSQPTIGHRSGEAFDPAVVGSNMATLIKLVAGLRHLSDAQQLAFEQDLLFTEVQRLLIKLAER